MRGQSTLKKEKQNVLYIEIGYYCNLECPYCFLKKYINKRYLQPSKDWVNVMSSFIKTISNYTSAEWEILLGGGETLLYDKYYIKLLKRILEEDLHNISKVTLLTNGLLFDKKFIEVLLSFKEKNKDVTILVSTHILNDIAKKNIERYIRNFSPYNVKLLKVITSKNIDKAFNIFESIYRFYLSLVSKYFRTNEKKIEFFEHFKNNLFEYLIFQPDVNENSSKFYRHFAIFWKKILSKILKREMDMHPKIAEIQTNYKICETLNKISRYIKVYPNLKISSCGWMTLDELNNKYFKQYTVFDIIDYPEILNESFYTNFGLKLSNEYAKLTYKISRKLGFDVPIPYCPLRAMRMNNGRLGVYSLDYIKALYIMRNLLSPRK